ncbi:MAG: hypothetical protein ACREPR_26670, partial [Brasilonema sp.]
GKAAKCVGIISTSKGIGLRRSIYDCHNLHPCFQNTILLINLNVLDARYKISCCQLLHTTLTPPLPNLGEG